MNRYKDLESILLTHKESGFAAWQTAYMRHKFSFFGVRQPVRKKIQRPFLLSCSKKDISTLWKKDQREYQYIAMDVLIRSHLNKGDLDLLEWLITTKSWWDSVDVIASNIVGKFFQTFPDLLQRTQTWVSHESVWLRRSSLIFQLRYKEKTDATRLFSFCKFLSKDADPFIQRAIGWALREYSKRAPSQVESFLKTSHFSQLSVREASRYIPS